MNVFLTAGWRRRFSKEKAMPEMKKILPLLVLGMLIQGAGYAAEKTASQEDERDPVNPLFTGVRYENENTTLVQGTELGIDPSTIYGGGFTAGDLSQFERHVVSVSDGNGTFTLSEQSKKTESSAGTAGRENQKAI